MSYLNINQEVLKRLWQTIIYKEDSGYTKNVQERTRQSGKNIGSMSPQKKRHFSTR